MQSHAFFFFSRPRDWMEFKCGLLINLRGRKKKKNPIRGLIKICEKGALVHAAVIQTTYEVSNADGSSVGGEARRSGSARRRAGSTDPPQAPVRTCGGETPGPRGGAAGFKRRKGQEVKLSFDFLHQRLNYT